MWNKKFVYLTHSFMLKGVENAMIGGFKFFFKLYKSKKLDFFEIFHNVKNISNIYMQTDKTV